MTLYEIAREYQELLEMMGDPEIDDEVIRDTMEAVQGEAEVKADSYCVMAKKLESDNAMDEAEIARLEARVRSRKRNIKRMKEALEETLRWMGVRKLPTQHFTISLARNGGKAPLQVDDAVPPEYCSLVPDTARIRKDIEDGKELAFARLLERGEHLVVK